MAGALESILCKGNPGSSSSTGKLAPSSAKKLVHFALSTKESSVVLWYNDIEDNADHDSDSVDVDGDDYHDRFGTCHNTNLATTSIVVQTPALYSLQEYHETAPSEECEKGLDAWTSCWSSVNVARMLLLYQL